MAEAISGLTGTLQGTVTSLGDTAQAWIDKILPPETRNKIMAWISKFAAEKPMLASFLASHIALSGPAIGLFMVMTGSIAVFALIVAIIVALLGTVLFIVTVAGFFLIFLFPVLFVTTGVATFLWLWGLGCYYLLKYFNKESIPGIHTGLQEGLEGEAKNYADRGEKEGYGQGMLENGSSPEEKKGQQQREEAEKTAVEKYKGKPQEMGKGAMDKGTEGAGQVKEKGGKAVGKATDTVDGIAGKTPAGGVTGSVTGAAKGITG